MWFASVVPLVVALMALVLGGSSHAPHAGGPGDVASADVFLQEATRCWVGTVGTAPETNRAVLEVTGSGEEATGAIHVFGSTIVDVELSSFEIDGTSVTSEVRAPDGDSGTFTATIDGDRLSGTATGPSGTNAVSLTEVDPLTEAPERSLLGYWEGGLLQGTSILLNLALRIEEAPCGQVLVTMDSPDQGAEDIPISAVSLDGNEFRFEVGVVGGGFDGTLSEDGQSVRGTWSQGGQSLTMELER